MCFQPNDDLSSDCVLDQASGGALVVTAVHPFTGQQPGDLSFAAGDRITVITKTDSQYDWWEGELRGQVGIFPANFVSYSWRYLRWQKKLNLMTNSIWYWRVLFLCTVWNDVYDGVYIFRSTSFVWRDEKGCFFSLPAIGKIFILFYFVPFGYWFVGKEFLLYRFF